MLEVWVAPIGKLDPDALIWKNKVSKERWQASRNIKKVEARARSLGAELLLNHALKAFLSPEAFPVRCFQDEKGKKYLANAFCHFNLSHSGEYVACVLSDQPVGIDIQQCRNVQLDMARRFLTVPEQQAFLGKCKEEQKEFFFDTWVLKESYVKMLGEGLTYLRKGCSLQLDEPILMEDPANLKPRRFQLWKEIPQYRCAICVQTDEPIFPQFHVLSEGWL